MKTLLKLLMGAGLCLCLHPALAETLTDEDYHLAPSDMVVVRVLGDKEFDFEGRVTKKGALDVPWLGVVEVKGKTKSEVVKMLKEKLVPDYYVNPQIVLEIKDYSDRTVTVLGQVNQPGQVKFPSEQGLTVAQAIGFANGFGKSANKKKIQIIRGGKPVMEFNFQEHEKGTSKVKIPSLEPGDIIVVPETLF
jgi:protein involved in polysaccharide export with SLBB domain